ncbi:hypothetical protein WH50_18305 [Pokkaliibacter plantistimulans]|uniref:Transposase n=1 Tax=Pokkaliibacter plantistimulans TaxID=1635171 RepID=A0ABX5LTB4_9GAMM|nr:hypothetical protein WH50_18305 [Pokkaliibacter plantistimulans]
MKKSNLLNVLHTENNKRRMFANILFKACEMEIPEGFGRLNRSQAMSDQIHGVMLARIRLIALTENGMVNPKSSLV